MDIADLTAIRGRKEYIKANGKITKNTLVNWEKGLSEPTITQGRRLSELYKIPLDNIFLPNKSN